VLLPFAAGYYLSYLFRSINALIAGDLTAELGLSAADLGLLTSVYFLLFAAAQLPFGVLLDRHGPATIQSGLLLIASAGALVFALADGLIRSYHRPRPDRPRRCACPDVGLSRRSSSGSRWNASPSPTVGLSCWARSVP
jgi:MFS family permease